MAEKWVKPEDMAKARADGYVKVDADRRKDGDVKMSKPGKAKD